MAQGRTSGALDDLEAAVIALPNIPDAYIARAQAYSELGDLPDALIDLNVALALSPASAEALEARGEVYRQLGQPEQAIPDFEAALESGPASFSLLLHLGQAYLEVGRAADAEIALSRAVLLNPEEPEGHYWYGLASFASSNYAQAVSSASIVLAYEPQSIEALSLRATANLYWGYLSDAQADFKEEYRIDPTYVEALIGLAEIHIRQGDYAAAEDALSTYLSVAPPNAPSRTAAQAALGALATAGDATPSASLLDPRPYAVVGH